MGYIFSIMFGAVVGFLIASILSTGKVSDLESKVWKLKKENYKLNNDILKLMKDITVKNGTIIGEAIKGIRDNIK